MGCPHRIPFFSFFFLTSLLLLLLIPVGGERQPGTLRVVAGSGIRPQLLIAGDLKVAGKGAGLAVASDRTRCSRSDISISQGRTGNGPGGIPVFSVQVFNTCPNPGCVLLDIHIACAWFASARLVNPALFRRLGFNDCLLNNGRQLPVGDSVSFTYSNSFPYPLSVKSVISIHC